MAAAREGTKQNMSNREFSGINTQNSRPNIGDDEFAWIENVMPVAHGHMKVVPGPSVALVTVPVTCNYMKSANISNVDYMFMFCTDGSAYQVNLTTNVKTTIAAAGKFSGTLTRIEQWKDERILIIDANGYWDWNGTTLTSYNGTLQSITVTSYGVGYTSRPTVGFTPAGSGAAATAHIGAALATIVGAGTGYAVNDILTVSGGTSTVAAQIEVTTVSAGAITAISLILPGDYTVIPANPVSVTGGYGTAATFNLNFGVTQIVITNPGSGYASAPVVGLSGGGASVQGTATAFISATPTAGTAIAVYQGRVWIATGNGRTIAFSAPNDYTDFSTANAGGSFILTDPTMVSTIQQLMTANDFLYIFGTNSINILSNVRVSSGVTNFSNTNVSSNIGSTMPLAIESYYRSVMFANPSGIYALYGSTATKASSKVDNLYDLFDPTKPFTSGLVVLYGQLCYAMLVSYLDPAGTRPLILMFNEKKWFLASQSLSLTLIESAGSTSNQALYGTDGTSLYKLFARTNVDVNHKIETKLYDMDDSLLDKQVLRVGVEATGSSASIFTLTIDTEYTSTTASLKGQVGTWINDDLNVGTWTNNSLYIGIWFSGGYQFMRSDANGVGKYVGLTLTSSTSQKDYNAFHIQYEKRANW